VADSRQRAVVPGDWCVRPTGYGRGEYPIGDCEDAVNWIIDNQLGRRNLTPEQWDYLLGKTYNRDKTVGHGDKSAYQNDPQNRERAERLADEYKVSEKTVKRDGLH
jgi:hypothetical protein